MSFSGNVKEELSEHWSSARHCQIAELSAILGLCGSIIINSRNEYRVKVHTENKAVARKVFTLIKKTFNIESDISIRRNIQKQSVSYSVVVKQHQDALRVLQAVKLIDEHLDGFEEVRIVNPIVVQQTCCKRAFIRGAFLAAGSMSDPKKAYHFEIVCAAEPMAEQIRELMSAFQWMQRLSEKEIICRISQRRLTNR